MFDFLKSDKFLCFVGGVAAAVVGKKLLSTKKARKMAVSTVACGMKCYDNTKSAIQSIKDEAADICHDAKCEAAELSLDEAETPEVSTRDKKKTASSSKA